MVQPNDYTINSPSPFLMAEQGFGLAQQQQKAAQDILAGRQNMDINAQQEQRAATAFDQGQQDRATGQVNAQTQAAAAQAMKADFAALGAKVADGTATSTDFAQLTLKYPEMASELKGVWDNQSADRKAQDTANVFKAATAIKAGKPDIAIAMLEDYATAAENSGQKMDADLARATAGIIKADPNAGLTQLGILLHSLDPKASEDLFGKAAAVQSSQILEDGTVVAIMNDGKTQVTDPTGVVVTGQAAADAVKAANAVAAENRKANAGGAQQGKLGADIAMGGEAAGTVEAGKQAIAKSGEAYDMLTKANANIANVDNAIGALDSGAKSGAIQRYFPNISAASASLENAMNRLGLDVINSATFGALSEGEMKLAMETAVPRNLDEPSLRAWLVSKKVAQEKAADALYQAAVYLGTPGNTLSGWLAEHPRGNVTTAPPEAAGSGSQTSGQAPSFDDALSKYGGGSGQ